MAQVNPAVTALAAAVDKAFGAKITERDLNGIEPFLRCEPATWPELARFLKDRCGMDMLACLSGIDRGKGQGLEAVYNVESCGAQRTGISIRIRVPLDNPVIPSVESVWRTADWHERECWDLVGIRFEGHHNLVRILCAEDWEGHPLRKDYKSPDRYHGIKNNVV